MNFLSCLCLHFIFTFICSLGSNILSSFPELDARLYYPVYMSTRPAFPAQPVPLLSVLLSDQNDTLAAMRELLIYCSYLALPPTGMLGDAYKLLLATLGQRF